MLSACTLAAYLAQLGAGDIVLTSRRAPDAEAQRAIEDITERYRCRIHTFAADVGDESEVAKLLERIRAELPPLAGVVHLAGVLDDALLSKQSLERFRTTLAPKAFGAIYLDRLTKNDDLDFFIVSSSVSSLLGSPGKANYFDCQRVARWTGRGPNRARLAGNRGQLWPLGPGGHGLFRGRARQYRCARANSAGSRRPPSTRSPRLSPTEPGRQSSSRPTGSVPRSCWAVLAHRFSTSCCQLPSVRQPATVSCSGNCRRYSPVAQRAGFISEFLQREVQGFLRLAQPPAAASRFLDLGTDSLMAVQLRNRLHSQFGGAFTISATAVFDYPTIGGLAEYLAGQTPESAAQSGEAESVDAPAPT